MPEDSATPAANAHDFSLDSGERQTAARLDGVRSDHTARYALAADVLGRRRRGRMFGLDAFCGTGYGAAMLADALGCAVLGIDGSAESVAFARGHFARDAVLYCHKVFPFLLPAGTFDFVTCFESIEHVEADALLLERLAGCLKPRGLLFLSAPSETELPLGRVRNPFHHRHYLHRDVLALAKAAGGLRLLAHYGQDVYRLEDGRVRGTLPPGRMALRPGECGQFNVYLFQRRPPRPGA